MKYWVKNWLTRHLFKTVDTNDVISCDAKGVVRLGSEVITEAEAKSLEEEAKFVEKTRLWRIMTETVRLKALETGFTKSTSYDDLKTSKLMVVNLDILESIVRIAKRVK